VRGQSSVLSTGKWFKVAVETRGVYKITSEQFKKMGFGNIDPRKIKVFGNVGGMLPQANDQPRPYDLTENAIFVSGESDGTFDKQDYILFFAEGADRVRYDVQRETFSYETNLYSLKNFYFLTVAETDGLRITVETNLDGDFPVIEQYDDFIHYELEKLNLLSSGREWFGERFDFNPERTFTFEVDGITENSSVTLISDVVGASYAASSFDLYWNSTAIATQTIPNIPNTPYGVKGIHKRDTITFNANVVGAPTTGSQSIRYQFSKAASGASSGYLDFFRLHVKRLLSLKGHQTLFRSSESLSQQFSSFKLSNVNAACLIWNITDAYHPTQIEYSLDGATAQFSDKSDQLQEYIIFDPEVPSPELIGVVENQNLHGATTPNLIIISHPDFLSEAQRLAYHREQHNAWTTVVVTPHQIYNEFSSGRQDITAIRDFIKYLFDKTPGTLQAVLLLGKGSYDYKDRIPNNTNFVATYESRNSLAPLATYSSDDYFGFLENSEGNWGESPAQNHTLDVGVGRLPVKTLAEAKNIVDKIINYDINKKAFGHWRKDIVFVGDDGNNADNFTSSHQSQANVIAESIESSHAEFNTKKIFLGTYEKTSRPAGEIIPEAQEDIAKRFDRGSLIVNFTGHGNERQWADEKIFSDHDIEQLENKLYPFLVTATCEFGRQDDPTVVSSAELSILRKNGGAIGLVTTARPVNAGTNFVLNQQFYSALFQKNAGRYATIGEVFRNTKNNSISGVANRNFSLLGDPSMTLALPSASIEITNLETMNGSDTLKALSTVRLSGEIHDEAGEVIKAFNGVLEFTLFDKEQEFVTIGKNNPPFQFKQWSNSLYRGRTAVVNGVFEFEFILTKNIDDEIGTGKLSAYAVDLSNALDAGGSRSFKIGGIEADAATDNTPPTIQLYMGDTTFVSGGIVSTNTTLVVKLQDDSGINISGRGIDNGLAAYLDNEEQPFILNDYYEAYTDDFTKGSVNFPMNGLSPGRHSITVKASDIHNNAGQATIEFIVTDDENIVIETLGNFPNPFQSETSVFFTHNRSGDDLEAQLTIYSARGEQLKTYEFNVPGSPYHVDLGQINDLYDFGKKLPGGVYLARLAVRSLTNGSKNERVTKLIVVN
jgi:hypothetical protein